MLFETGVHDEQQCLLRSKEYAATYAAKHVGLQRLLARASRYLERQYLSLMKAEIERNKNMAKKGGKPGEAT